MVTSFVSLLLALLALGFIIFIHELGHYWMARRSGMRVEAFGIGFGKPIVTLMRKGVRWNIGWIPFGGYVKIAGMEKEGDLDPKDIQDGFFGSPPISRILVAFAGPLANIILSFVLFFAVFAMGGRTKPFSEVTNRIGWVDPDSELYQSGVRPGDIVLAYDNKPFHLSSDHLQASMTARDSLVVEGLKKTDQGAAPFRSQVRPYSFPKGSDSGIRTSGIMVPANFLVWNPLPGELGAFASNTPILSSGIKPKDRIVWVNGEEIYSSYQLSTLFNSKTTFLTVKRGAQILQLKVPVVAYSDCKIEPDVRGEIADWQWAAGLKSVKPNQLVILPYNLTNDAVVEGPLEILEGSKIDTQLLPSDIIMAIQGVPITNSTELLQELQKHKAIIIVERMAFEPRYSMKEATQLFDLEGDQNNLKNLLKQVGSGKQAQAGNLYLLSPVELASLDAENGKKMWLLGLSQVTDINVIYNPGPIETIETAVTDMYRTLSALVSGYLSPKWLSGPVGMVQIIQKQTGVSVPDALFWIGLISLYLALTNLLPLPVLDGGYILLALFELVTGKKVSTKALEKLIMVFTVILIGLIIFVTYHDIVRLIGGLLG